MEALGPLLDDLGTSWGGLGSLLEALGPLLGDLGSFLGELEAVLVRSWGLLAPSWAVLEGQEAQKGSGPGGLADQGREVLPPRRGLNHSDPPLELTKEGSGKRKTGLWTTGKREESGTQGRGKSQDHREDGRVEKKRCSARPEAQGAGGFFP